jgi:calmodulin
LEPKFLSIVKDPKYKELPILFSDLSVMGNKDYIKSLGVLALPSIQFYAGKQGGLVESFPCGPTKVPILKEKLAQLIKERVDPKTRLLTALAATTEETEPCAARPLTTGRNDTITVGGVEVSEDKLTFLRTSVPYFADFTDAEFYGLMSKAKLLSFEPSSIIMREGKPGKTFYVIDSGEVEISLRTAFADPLTTPSSYLGTVINKFGPNEFFGERSLITGEPRAASVVAWTKTRCFAFNINDIPSSSILSGKGGASEYRMQQVNSKYGVDFGNMSTMVKSQLDATTMGSQIRGSVNTPEVIRGVDTDEDDMVDDLETTVENPDNQIIIPLLVKFRMIRHASRCFDYIMTTQPRWGDIGTQRRRSMLVQRLTKAQQEEFIDVFSIIDQSKKGEISLLDLKRVMESVGETKSDAGLQAMISNTNMDGKEVITQQDFLGIMAEADFYHLFKDTFASMDKHNSGFVKASDLDRVLCGMRDLISDDRKSIIDVEDKDMMIDYEQFSKMLLGTSL